MDLKEIIQYVKTHPSGMVKIAYSDTDGVLRGKYIATEKFLSLVEKDSHFCDVIFGWDMADAAYNNVKFTGWHTGYPDAATRIDFNTFRKIPWEDGLPFFLGEMSVDEKNAAAVCPRQLLKRILAEATELGFTPYAAQEFEWFNFAETPRSAAEKQYKNLVPLTPGMFGYSILRASLKNDYFTDLFELLKKFDVPLVLTKQQSCMPRYLKRATGLYYLRPQLRKLLTGTGSWQPSWQRSAKTFPDAEVIFTRVFGIRHRRKTYFMTQRILKRSASV
jgi:glutamine synthetase